MVKNINVSSNYEIISRNSDSSKKLSDHSLVLVPSEEDTNNVNITTSSGAESVRNNVCSGGVSWNFFEHFDQVDNQLRIEDPVSTNTYISYNDAVTLDNKDFLMSKSKIQLSPKEENTDHNNCNSNEQGSIPIGTNKNLLHFTSSVIINSSSTSLSPPVAVYSTLPRPGGTQNGGKKTNSLNRSKQSNCEDDSSGVKLKAKSNFVHSIIIKQPNVSKMGAGTGASDKRTDLNGNGGGPRTTIIGNPSGLEYNLGIIGWRKKCLFIILFILLVLIVTNLALTLWILKVMEFSTNGMGQLKIIPHGVQLTGQTLIMDLLRASSIRSKHGQPITIESSRNFSINTRDKKGKLQNHLYLGHDKFECLTSGGFRITNSTGKKLFSVNQNEVFIGVPTLRIEGDGGVVFHESIQTSHVRAEFSKDLKLESPTRQLEMSAAKDINLISRAGGLEMNALNDIKFSAAAGSIHLDTSKIILPNLKTTQPPTIGMSNRDHQHKPTVYQLCACENGKLFLASAHTICAGDDKTVCSR
ncbi:SGCG family protein [Megaselia abdita]